MYDRQESLRFLELGFPLDLEKLIPAPGVPAQQDQQR